MDGLTELLGTKGFLVLDGAMGTELFTAGLMAGDPPEIWNMEHPDRIRAIQDQPDGAWLREAAPTPSPRATSGACTSHNVTRGALAATREALGGAGRNGGSEPNLRF